LQENILRPQSTAVYSGAIRSAYLTEKAASVDGLFQRQAGYWPVSDLKWPKLILLVALFEQKGRNLVEENAGLESRASPRAIE
jgi:hypothetical protein